MLRRAFWIRRIQASNPQVEADLRGAPNFKWVLLLMRLLTFHMGPSEGTFHAVHLPVILMGANAGLASAAALPCRALPRPQLIRRGRQRHQANIARLTWIILMSTTFSMAVTRLSTAPIVVTRR